MKRVLLFLWMLLACSLQAEIHDNTLAPNLRFITSAPLNCGAYSLLGEVGHRNFRVGATYGYEFCYNLRAKVSGEYLTQRIDYHFHRGGHDKRWVHQYALGGVLQYQTCCCWLNTIDFGAAYSHAFSKRVGELQRIAGSNGEFVYIGSDFCLWDYSSLYASLDYDHVKYNRHYQSDRTASGVGATVKFVQLFCNDFALALTGEFKQPFRFYEAAIKWRQPCRFGVLDWAVYANYTDGSKGLPNIATAGLEVSFAFNGCSDYCCDTNFDPYEYLSASPCCLSDWVAQSAVYIPVVLAIKDEGDPAPPPPPPCIPPTSVSIADIEIFAPAQVSIALAPFFSSSTPLTFVLTGALPAGLTFDPATGVISGIYDGPSGTFPVTVTATNGCGSTSQSFTIFAFIPG